MSARQAFPETQPGSDDLGGGEGLHSGRPLIGFCPELLRLREVVQLFPGPALVPRVLGQEFAIAHARQPIARDHASRGMGSCFIHVYVIRSPCLALPLRLAG